MALLRPSTPAVAETGPAVLPAGVEAVWSLEKAHRETTPSRERYCLNGLWQWQPAPAKLESVPVANWGYFKVPGCWPGITDYMQKDCQRIFAHPNWNSLRLGETTAAWYQRDFKVPRDWGNRAVGLQVDHLNSYAAVFVDGARVGELRFPGGELDITAACRPGQTHQLSLHVLALPLKGVMISYSDTASAREVKGTVERRGLCGDVYLLGTPRGPRIDEARIATSFREESCQIDVAVQGLIPEETYWIYARVLENDDVVQEFPNHSFKISDLKKGRLVFARKWKPERLWDLNTPQNTYDLEIQLLDSKGGRVDTYWAERFGFREFWIDGKDFYLNGTRIFLSAVPLDNAQVSAAAATYGSARETLLRLKSFGINFVYTHNYGCEPGSHLGFEEILRAADDTGMLVSFSQPHFSHYEWQSGDADESNGYARHARYYTSVAGSHPSVVAYSMSHNATGYNEDMNPNMIDGIQAARDSWSQKNAVLAMRAENIVRQLDPSRLVYHHASGNLGALDAINFYPNFVPIQELSDWFGHWAARGVKPVFLCEYGAPFTWDWTMYRGWYQGEREFGSAKVPWEFCLAEWNAQFLGESAYRLSEAEKANLRWEATQNAAGKTWHRWDYPNPVGSTRFSERYPVFAQYLAENWRAFRTWGVSALSPWEHEHFWKLREGVDRSRREFKVDWQNLQRPGFSPDYEDQRYERMDLAFDRSDWVPTEAAKALLRNNRPLLAYIGGKPARFTSKDHVFMPGETIEKQIILVNNSREAVNAHSEWSCDARNSFTGSKTTILPTGEQERIPLSFSLPSDTAPGAYNIRSRTQFSNGETQEDAFLFQVIQPPPRLLIQAKAALFDPKGETTGTLAQLGVAAQPVHSSSDLGGYDLLIVGKAALSTEGAAPNIRRVRDGLRVLIFEQSPEVLEKRFGFRVAEYGLRQAFPRVPDHPALSGLGTEHLRDWRGEATLQPSQLRYEMRPRHGVTVQWCGMPVTRLWRCGNQGNVASVLIEKPARGDFLPIIDGGFGLQYSPLLEYREGRGLILFCQMDLIGRSETEPVAQLLLRNLLEYAASWSPPPRREAVYVGDPAGKQFLEASGVSLLPMDVATLSTNHVLITGPGGGRQLAAQAAAIAGWLRAGGNLLAIGFDQEDANACLPFKVELQPFEHISAYFPSPGMRSLLEGVCPADVHNRAPKHLPLLKSGARALGNGVLARAEAANVVFCQLVPWQFTGSAQANLRRTHRRAAFLLSRLLGNLGVPAQTPVIERFQEPPDPRTPERRWLTGLYADQPEEWDDPYRFFRW
jgi:hypothetical protein